MPSTRITIIGKSWTVKFLKAKKFNKEAGGDCYAITVTDDKEIIFPLKKLKLETVIHELTHAYMDELCLGNAVDLKKRQLEEFYCELMSKHGQTILEQAHKLIGHYNEIVGDV